MQNNKTYDAFWQVDLGNISFEERVCDLKGKGFKGE